VETQNKAKNLIEFFFRFALFIKDRVPRPFRLIYNEVMCYLRRERVRYLVKKIKKNRVKRAKNIDKKYHNHTYYDYLDHAIREGRKNKRGGSEKP